MAQSDLFDNVADSIDNEGFDYCFRHYSSFTDIVDSEFHRLRERYIAAANELGDYVAEHVTEGKKYD